MIWRIVLVCVVGYLLGNFQTGVLVSKQIGKFDVRKRGSKSPGTTNVLRTMGWLPSILTLAGDVLKGLLAGWIGLLLLGATGARIGGLAAVIGHDWPALYHFHGGKGIATSLGAILTIDPLCGACLLLWQILVVALTKTMSVASISSAVVYAVYSLIRFWGDVEQTAFVVILLALVLWTHRENLGRIRLRRENTLDFDHINRISQRKKKED